MSVLNVAVIGAGVGRAHIAEGYAKLRDRFRVVALCDIDAGRLAKVGGEFAVPRLTTAFAEVLAMADAWRSLELITALYHSAATGLPVEMPLTAGHPKYRCWCRG